MTIAKYRNNGGTKFSEAYTGNLVGRRGHRTFPKQFSPERKFVVDDVVNDAEVNTVSFDIGESDSGQPGSESVAC